jgi:hypothetical protein
MKLSLPVKYKDNFILNEVKMSFCFVFVPTMGTLHAVRGAVKASKRDNASLW